MTQSTKPASSDLPSLTTRMIVQNQFDLAADLIGLEDHLRRMLLMPFRVVAVEVPAQMDDGRIEVFRGYRVQHNAARGPCKGDSARVSARRNEQSGLRERANVRHSNLLHLGISLVGVDSVQAGFEALRETSERLRSLPDLFVAQEMRKGLAEAFIVAGDHEKALDELRRLMADPSAVSVALLRVDPIYDPLHGNAAFQALLAKYEN